MPKLTIFRWKDEINLAARESLRLDIKHPRVEVRPDPVVNEKHIKEAKKLREEQEANRRTACRETVW